MQRLRFALILLVFMIALALQALPTQATRVVGNFSRIYEGVEYATGSDTSPRLMKAFALRISLGNPEVAMYASHDNGAAAYEVALQTTPAFLADHGCKAAVNSCYFNAGLSPNTDIEGLLISNGTLVSSWQTARTAELLLTSDKVASIVAASGNPTGIYTACSGDAYMLVNGTCLGDNVTPEPRTTAGLSQDGKYLILVCVDGRQSGYSMGATIYEMAHWQQDFGAYNAFNLDGGGSTTMTRADVGDVNRPCYGYDRSVGASLGVKSTTANAQGPSACSMNPNRIDLVYRGNMSHVYIKTWTSTGGWDDPVDLGGTTYDSPSIIARADGHLNVFIRGTNNQLYHKFWSVAGWSGWVSLGGNILSGPAASFRDSDHIDVFARGNDNTVHHIYWSSANDWGAWESLAGITYDSPAAVSRDANHINLFCRNTSNGLSHKYWFSGVGWSAWESLGGSMTSGPAVCSLDANHINVFFRGAANDLQQIFWNNVNGWSGALSLSGGLAGKPAACCRDAAHMDTWVRGPQDYLFQKSWNGTTGWADTFTSLGYMF